MYSWGNICGLIYRCIICKAVLKLGRGTINVERHLTTRHLKEDTTSLGSETWSECSFTKIQNLIYKQNKWPFGNRSNKQPKLVQLCTKWVEKDLRPLQVVDEKGFKAIVGKLLPFYHSVISLSMKRTLQSQSDKWDSSLHSFLEKVPFVSVTTDVCTNESKRSYSSIKVHFVDEN